MTGEHPDVMRHCIDEAYKFPLLRGSIIVAQAGMEDAVKQSYINEEHDKNVTCLLMFPMAEEVNEVQHDFKTIRRTQFIGQKSKIFRKLSTLSKANQITVGDIKKEQKSQKKNKFKINETIDEFILQKIQFAECDRMEYPVVVFKSNDKLYQ